MFRNILVFDYAMNVRDNILKILDDAGIEYKLMEHGHIHTSRDACAVRGCHLSQCTKSMIFKTNDGQFILAVCPGDKKVDTRKIGELEGGKKLRLASLEDDSSSDFWASACSTRIFSSGGIPFNFSARNFSTRSSDPSGSAR